MAPVAAESHYTVLDVPFNASEADIKAKYKESALRCHPDRVPPEHRREALEHFPKIEVAYRCLSNDARRLVYDLRVFGYTSLADGKKSLAHLNEIQKQQATVDVANMQDALAKIIAREQLKGGIIVKKAIYGNLRMREDLLMTHSVPCQGKQTIEESALQGPFIDVTQSVQALVEQHRILIPGGVQSSKADLAGFYNPAPMDMELELELYVLYEFKRQLHEVIVGDREMLSCPLRAHAVAKMPGQMPRGPYSRGNVNLQMELEERARRAPAKSTTAINKGGKDSPESDALSSPGKPRDWHAALERATIGYRLASLRVPYPGDATPCEFATLALCGGATVTLALAWTRYGGLFR